MEKSLSYTETICYIFKLLVMSMKRNKFSDCLFADLDNEALQLEWLSRDNLLSPPFALVTYRHVKN